MKTISFYSILLLGFFFNQKLSAQTIPNGDFNLGFSACGGPQGATATSWVALSASPDCGVVNCACGAVGTFSELGVPTAVAPITQGVYRFVQGDATSGPVLDEAAGVTLSAPLVAGTTYVLSFNACFQQSAGLCSPSPAVLAPNNNMVGFRTGSGATGGQPLNVNFTGVAHQTWTSFTITFTASANHNFFYINPLNMGQWYSVIFDNIVLNTPLSIFNDTFDVFCDDDAIKLRWQTETNDNISKFNIYKSNNGYEFIEIGSVDYIEKPFFEFNDYKVEQNVYYKIIQLNKDGSYSNLPLKSIETCDDVDISVYLRNKSLHINFNNGKKRDLVILVHDVNGKRITEKEILSESSEYIFEIPLNIESGIYYFSLIVDDKVINKRFYL